MAAEQDFLRLAQQFSFNRMPELAQEAIGHAAAIEKGRRDDQAWRANMQRIQQELNRQLRAVQQPARRAPTARGETPQRKFRVDEEAPRPISQDARRFIERVLDQGAAGSLHTFVDRSNAKRVVEYMATVVGTYVDQAEGRICRAVMIGVRTSGDWQVSQVVFWRQQGAWIRAGSR